MTLLEQDALLQAIEHVETQAQDYDGSVAAQASLQGCFRISSRQTTPPPPVTSNKRPASESPQKPLPKCGGGCGHGRGHGAATHSKTLINVGTKTPKTKAVILTDPPNDDVFTSIRWTTAEQTSLFTHLFSSDSDDIHTKWLKNKDHVYKKVLSLVFCIVVPKAHLRTVS